MVECLGLFYFLLLNAVSVDYLFEHLHETYKIYFLSIHSNHITGIFQIQSVSYHGPHKLQKMHLVERRTASSGA